MRLVYLYSSYYSSLVKILFVQKEIKLITENATLGKHITDPAVITGVKIKTKL